MSKKKPKQLQAAEAAPRRNPNEHKDPLYLHPHKFFNEQDKKREHNRNTFVNNALEPVNEVYQAPVQK